MEATRIRYNDGRVAEDCVARFESDLLAGAAEVGDVFGDAAVVDVFEGRDSSAGHVGVRVDPAVEDVRVDYVADLRREL